MTVSFGKERVGFGNRPAGDPVSPTNFDIACSFVSAGPIPSDAKNTMAGPGLSVRKSISEYMDGEIGFDLEPCWTNSSQKNAETTSKIPDMPKPNRNRL